MQSLLESAIKQNFIRNKKHEKKFRLIPLDHSKTGLRQTSSVQLVAAQLPETLAGFNCIQASGITR